MDRRNQQRAKRLLSPASFSIVAAAVLTISATPASSDNLSYLQCMEQFCPSGSPDLCSSNICERELNVGTRKYGAIAVATATLDYGYAYGHSSRAEAERAAMQECIKQVGSTARCEIGTWFYNNCAALATSSEKGAGGNVWSAKWSQSERAAGALAMEGCRSDGGNHCTIAVAYCSS